MEYEFEGCCYVLPQTDEINPIAYHRHDLVWYPERSMTFYDTVCYIPFVRSVVTENPYIVSCYPRECVFIWENGKWENPNVQTYGASVNMITMSLLGYNNTIPLCPMGGRAAIQEFKTKHNIR